MRRLATALTTAALALTVAAAPALAKEDTSGRNLVDTAIAVNASGQFAGEFEILLSLVTSLGLDEALDNKGQLTVFAPTDAAFEAVLPLVDGCTADELRAIVLYHVARGARDAGEVTSSSKIKMLAGGFAAVDGATIDGANIIVTDVVASNGIIHAVDAVLVPDWFTPDCA